jgi:hypothetical protein
MRTYEVLINHTGDPDDWEPTGQTLTEEEALEQMDEHPFGTDHDEEQGVICLFNQFGQDFIQLRSNDKQEEIVYH